MSWTSILTVPYLYVGTLHRHNTHTSCGMRARGPPPPLPWYDPIPLAAANPNPLGRCRRCHERVISLYRPPKRARTKFSPVTPVPCPLPPPPPPCPRNPGPAPVARRAWRAWSLCNSLAGHSTSVNLTGQAGVPLGQASSDVGEGEKHFCQLSRLCKPTFPRYESLGWSRKRGLSCMYEWYCQ